MQINRYVVGAFKPCNTTISCYLACRLVILNPITVQGYIVLHPIDRILDPYAGTCPITRYVGMPSDSEPSGFQ